MKVLQEFGKEGVAKVYLAEVNGRPVEFAESQPTGSLTEKWVVIISCLYGCPVKCLMCDAGRQFSGLITKEGILEQIDHVVLRRFPDGNIPSQKFKIQFTRMGEPAFNPAVLEVLSELHRRYQTPNNLIVSLSTVGPAKRSAFFKKLIDIKNSYYAGRFQLQFSIHTTDKKLRDRLIPIPKISFKQIAAYGKRFRSADDRKVTLNFIVMGEYPIDPQKIAEVFDPNHFLIKLTPLNPTRNATSNKLSSKLNPKDGATVAQLVHDFKAHGFEVVVSIGEQEENEIGSNCGQYVTE